MIPLTLGVRRHNSVAASVASLLITTEAMVAEKPKDKAPSMPGGGAAWAAWISKSDAQHSAEMQNPGRNPGVF